jgi:hypothetical protein
MATATLLASSLLFTPALFRGLNFGDHCHRGNNGLSNLVSWVPGSFRKSPFSLCSSACRSCLDGLCSAPRMACAPFLLHQQAMRSPHLRPSVFPA